MPDVPDVLEVIDAEPRMSADIMRQLGLSGSDGRRQLNLELQRLRRQGLIRYRPEKPRQGWVRTEAVNA